MFPQNVKDISIHTPIIEAIIDLETPYRQQAFHRERLCRSKVFYHYSASYTSTSPSTRCHNFFIINDSILGTCDSTCLSFGKSPVHLAIHVVQFPGPWSFADEGTRFPYRRYAIASLSIMTWYVVVQGELCLHCIGPFKKRIKASHHASLCRLHKERDQPKRQLQ